MQATIKSPGGRDQTKRQDGSMVFFPRSGADPEPLTHLNNIKSAQSQKWLGAGQAADKVHVQLGLVKYLETPKVDL